MQKKPSINWKVVAYEAVIGGFSGGAGFVTGGVGTTAVVVSAAGKSAARIVAKNTAKKVAGKAVKTGMSNVAAGFVTDVGRQVVVDGKSFSNLDYGQAVKTAGVSGGSGMIGSAIGSVTKVTKKGEIPEISKHTENVPEAVETFTTKAKDTIETFGKKSSSSMTVNTAPKANTTMSPYKGKTNSTVVKQENRSVGNSGVSGSRSGKIEGNGKGGKLTIVDGGVYSQSEINAAQYVADLGNDVTLRPPVGTRAAGGTSDLLVNGINYDVYTPVSNNPSAIIRGMTKKNTQATGIVLDLSKTTVTSSDLGNSLGRIKGAIEKNGGTCNINDIIIMPK